MRKLIGAAALAATLLAVMALPALGAGSEEDPAVWPQPDITITHEAPPGELIAGLDIRQRQSGSGGDGGGSSRSGSGGGVGTPPPSDTPTYTCYPDDRGCVHTPSSTTDGYTAMLACLPVPGGGCTAYYVRIGPPAAQPAAQPTVQPLDIARSLLSSMTLPKPRIGMNPQPGERQLVNIPGGSWLWIEQDAWQPVIASASYPVEDPVETVVVTAEPVAVAWDLQDGPIKGHVDCNGPGTPYDRSLPPDAQRTDCSYTFRHAAEAATVTATITWQITWSASGVIDDAGTFPDQTTPNDVDPRVVGSETVSAA